ncbi:hypothetical protein EVAR_626_1 [Eumeta japonica]|uniref:Uncharacterized protein n=1 Tax=Eumeta variegata TaxID=151549 RepID=A0A4C1SE88_EUMVA|nr:hypothetical protein EVAR_626_1 [Eumeta japonica]
MGVSRASAPWRRAGLRGYPLRFVWYRHSWWRRGIASLTQNGVVNIASLVSFFGAQQSIIDGKQRVREPQMMWMDVDDRLHQWTLATSKELLERCRSFKRRNRVFVVPQPWKGKIDEQGVAERRADDLRKQANQDLQYTLGANASPYSTVVGGCAEFKRGRTSTKYDRRSGHPPTVVIEEMGQKSIRALGLQNAYRYTKTNQGGHFSTVFGNVTPKSRLSFDSFHNNR